MGLRFEFEVHGGKLISRELKGLGARGIDASPAFEEIADLWMRAEANRFNTRGNGTWRPLAASTHASKARSPDPVVRANAGKVLVATGDLRRSLTRRGDPAQLLLVAPQQLVLGSLVEYARFHQLGEGVPVRAPLGFSEHAKRDTMRVLQRHVVSSSTRRSVP